VAAGDVDNDGDVDLLIGNNNGRTRLLINQAASGRHWLGLRLVTPSRGSARGRDLVGARVDVTSNQGRSFWRRARADGSYASANDPRVLVGLGDAAGPVGVRVQWPSGRTERFTDVQVDRYVTLTEGTGR
jgi:hypothetical protein